MSQPIGLRRSRSLWLVAALCAALLGALALAPSVTRGQSGPVPSDVLTLTLIGRYDPAIYDDEGAAEIVAYDPVSKRLFVVNSVDKTVDAIDISDPTAPALLFQIDIAPYGRAANSVAVSDGIVAVAVEADPKQDPGQAVFFDRDGNFINAIMAGALPDMITYSPDGNTVLVANEGEPDDDYLVDPEGSVTLIDVSGGVAGATSSDVTTVEFTAFNGAMLDPSIRIFGPGATVAQDLEPEYIAVSADSTTAWVTMQENNAFAIIDIPSGTVTDLVGLGFKDHSAPENPIDASDRDNAINIANWPVSGMYQPDAIAAYACGATTCIVSANEGDARDYDGFSEEERVKDLVLDATAFPDAATLQEDENIGRLRISNVMGLNNSGEYDALFSYGARSFSIWAADGSQIYDSQSDLEEITADVLPDHFNSNGDEPDPDKRSDDKGPEPEGVAIGQIGSRTFAFIGLERIGGVVVYDVTDPAAPSYVTYINSRNFDGMLSDGTAGDVSPEGLTFIQADQSPNGKPLLVVSFELSNTTSIYEITSNIPTAIELAAFDASYDAQAGTVTVSWATAGEIDHAGFNVVRISAESGAETQLNSALIASQNAASGGLYTFIDTPAAGTWHYALEDVDTSGVVTRHPTVTVVAEAPTSAALTAVDGGVGAPLALGVALLLAAALLVAVAAPRRVRR